MPIMQHLAFPWNVIEQRYQPTHPEII